MFHVSLLVNKELLVKQKVNTIIQSPGIGGAGA